jgi:hypothetical protein
MDSTADQYSELKVLSAVYSHIPQLQFATQAFMQKVKQFKYIYVNGHMQLTTTMIHVHGLMKPTYCCRLFLDYPSKTSNSLKESFHFC